MKKQSYCFLWRWYRLTNARMGKFSYFPLKKKKVKNLYQEWRDASTCVGVDVCVEWGNRRNIETVEPAVYWLALVLWLYSVEQMGRRWISTYPLSSIPPPTEGPSLNNQPRTCFHFPSVFLFFLFQFLLASFFFFLSAQFFCRTHFFTLSIDGWLKEKKSEKLMLECWLSGYL